MDPSLYWAQSTLADPAQHTQQIQLDARTHVQPVDDWPKDRPATHTPQQHSHPPTLPSPTLTPAAPMDMEAILGVADLAGPTTSSLLSATTSYYPHSHYATSMWNNTGYPTVAYGQWPTTTVPVSSYSSLNGANPATPSLTSASSSSSSSSSQPAQPTHQQQQQAQQPPTPASAASMMIDSSTVNGTQAFSRSPFSPVPSSQSTLAAPRQSYYPFFSYYQPTTTSAPQGTLSPQALHSPSNSILAISPSAFYAPLTAPPAQHPHPPTQPQPLPQQAASSPSSSATPPETLSPEERKKQFHSGLQPLLQPNAFTGAQAVKALCNRINDYGMLDVDKKTRLEILSRIRDGAANSYYRAWSESVLAMTITRDWLKEAAKDGDTWLETIMPLLQLIDRLPFTIETLTMSKLGKIIRALIKDEPSPAIKDMASNLERRWRDLISAAQTDKKDPESKGGEDGKARKRKSDPSASVKAEAPPPKKVALGTPASVKPNAPLVKKEAKAAAPAVKDAKADSSFFSAPKAKPKLPTFKKAPATQVKKEDNIAQPSSYDPFQDVLKSLKTTRKESPAVSTPPPTGGCTPTTTGVGKNPTGKKKSVSWAPDDKLEQIKYLEKSDTEDDPVDGMHLSHNLRDMDRGEGAALHAHLFEEVIDWSEPQLLDFTADPERRVRGSESREKDIQEQREQTELSAVYMTPSQVPDSPGEPAFVLSEEETDKEMTIMTVGAQADPIFWNDDHGSAAPTGASVADLVSQLAAGAPVPTDPSPMMIDTIPPPSGGVMGGGAIEFPAIPPEQLQQLLSHLNAVGAAGGVAGWPMGPPPPVGGPPPMVNGGAGMMGPGGGHFGPEFGQPAYHEESDQMRWASHADGGNVMNRGRGSGGFRGRGRGRGGNAGGRGGEDGGYRVYKRKPCNFFAQGRRAPFHIIIIITVLANITNPPKHPGKKANTLSFCSKFPFMELYRCKFGDQCDFSHDPADHPQMLGM